MSVAFNGKKAPGGLRVVAVTAIAILMSGCVRRTTIEIDTTSATGFEWNGHVRITDQPMQRDSLFAPPDGRREVMRVELLSDDDRNVVIRPQANPKESEPYACIQDVGRPPDQFLVPLRKDVAEYEQAWQTLLALDETVPKEVLGATREAMRPAIAKYEQVLGHLQEREFQDITGAEAAFACAFESEQIETIYRLDDSTSVRVRAEEGSLLTVTIEDKDGTILYRYEPQPLPAAPVKDRR